MARKRHRMSGLSIQQVERVCASHYKGNQVKIDVCQTTGRSLIKRLVANKAGLCKTWCGCK